MHEFVKQNRENFALKQDQEELNSEELTHLLLSHYTYLPASIEVSQYSPGTIAQGREEGTG